MTNQTTAHVQPGPFKAPFGLTPNSPIQPDCPARSEQNGHRPLRCQLTDCETLSAPVKCVKFLAFGSHP